VCVFRLVVCFAAVGVLWCRRGFRLVSFCRFLVRFSWSGLAGVLPLASHSRRGSARSLSPFPVLISLVSILAVFGSSCFLVSRSLRLFSVLCFWLLCSLFLFSLSCFAWASRFFLFFAGLVWFCVAVWSWFSVSFAAMPRLGCSLSHVRLLFFLFSASFYGLAVSVVAVCGGCSLAVSRLGPRAFFFVSRLSLGRLVRVSSLVFFPFLSVLFGSLIFCCFLIFVRSGSLGTLLARSRVSPSFCCFGRFSCSLLLSIPLLVVFCFSVFRVFSRTAWRVSPLRWFLLPALLFFSFALRLAVSFLFSAGCCFSPVFFWILLLVCLFLCFFHYVQSFPVLLLGYALVSGFGLVGALGAAGVC